MERADPRVTDQQALAEIELYGNVVIAASAATRALSTTEIDRVLGVRPADPGTADQPNRPAM